MLLRQNWSKTDKHMKKTYLNLNDYISFWLLVRIYFTRKCSKIKTLLFIGYHGYVWGLNSLDTGADDMTHQFRLGVQFSLELLMAVLLILILLPQVLIDCFLPLQLFQCYGSLSLKPIRLLGSQLQLFLQTLHFLCKDSRTRLRWC